MRKSILKMLGVIAVLYVAPQTILDYVLEGKLTDPAIVHALVNYTAAYGLGYALVATVAYLIFWSIGSRIKRVDPLVYSIIIWFLLVIGHGYLEYVHPMITDRGLLITTVLFYSVSYISIVLFLEWFRWRWEEIDKTKK